MALSHSLLLNIPLSPCRACFHLRRRLRWTSREARDYFLPLLPLLVPIEKFEDARQDHRHHATVIAVHLEVLEIESATTHELGERTASFERRRSPCSLGHEDRQLPDQVERIARGIDERAGHRC